MSGLLVVLGVDLGVPVLIGEEEKEVIWLAVVTGGFAVVVTEVSGTVMAAVGTRGTEMGVVVDPDSSSSPSDFTVTTAGEQEEGEEVVVDCSALDLL